MNAASKLRFPDDEAFHSLREGDLVKFQKLIATRQEVDLSGSDLRGAVLRGADLAKVNLRGAYLRDADLRGQDLSNHDLEGCSIFHAHISGVYFPKNLTPEEIRMSWELGTRLRIK